MRGLVVLAFVVAVSAEAPQDPVDSEELTPKYVEFKLFGIVDNMISGEISFEKAFLEYTDHMNGYGAFLAHSCDEFMTLLNAETDDQNPNQANAEVKLDEKEAADANATTEEDALKGLVNQLNPMWEKYVESWVPVGWREQMEAVQTPSMVDSAQQPDVLPFLQFVADPSTPRYSMVFKASIPSHANVIVLYGGKYMPDPLHELMVSAGKVGADTQPKEIFVPLSRPIVLPIKREDDKSLYMSPLNPSFQGYVENGVVNGVLNFAGAFYENWFKGYVILLGTGPHAWQRIGTEFSFVNGIVPVGRRPDGQYEVQFRNVVLAPHATHILIFGGHPHNCNKPAGVNLFPVKPVEPQAPDPVIPDNTTPENIQFITEGPRQGHITGTLQFNRAKDTDSGLGYAVQFAANMTLGSRVPLYGGNPHTDFFIGLPIYKVDSQLVYEVFLDSVPIPRGAAFLKISQFSHYNPAKDPKAAPSPWGTPAFVPLTGGKGTY